MKKKFAIGFLLFTAVLLIAWVVFEFRYVFSRSYKPGFQNYRVSRIPEGYTMHGLDVSHYQGRINWDKLGKINRRHNVGFVMIRATMGALGEDKEFHRNWKAAKRKQLIRGAYHYYNPDVNSSLQAENFILTVDLDPGDLPPVLDIEKVSRLQDIDGLRKGVRRWLERVERHFGVRPIVYTGAAFYDKYLRGHFDDYPLWVANYNRVNHPLRDDWIFWQYTETGTIEGVRGFVDFNVFYGTREQLKRMAI